MSPNLPPQANTQMEEKRPRGRNILTPCRCFDVRLVMCRSGWIISGCKDFEIDFFPHQCMYFFLYQGAFMENEADCPELKCVGGVRQTV